LVKREERTEKRGLGGRARGSEGNIGGVGWANWNKKPTRWGPVKPPGTGGTPRKRVGIPRANMMSSYWGTGKRGAKYGRKKRGTNGWRNHLQVKKKKKPFK